MPRKIPKISLHPKNPKSLCQIFRTSFPSCYTKKDESSTNLFSEVDLMMLLLLLFTCKSYLVISYVWYLLMKWHNGVLDTRTTQKCLYQRSICSSLVGLFFHLEYSLLSTVQFFMNLMCHALLRTVFFF